MGNRRGGLRRVTAISKTGHHPAKRRLRERPAEDS